MIYSSKFSLFFDRKLERSFRSRGSLWYSANSIIHDLSIAKLQAYGFENDSTYLFLQEQRTKINTCPLFFNINTLDMFFEQKDVNFAAYADDNTPFLCEQNLEVLLSKLQIWALKLLEWFSNNYMKMNSYKCHLILSSNDKNKKIELNGEVINKTQIEKLLGFQIDYKLKFGTLLKLCVRG